MVELQQLAGEQPIVFPMHPRTRKMCEHFGIRSTAAGTCVYSIPSATTDREQPSGKELFCRLR
jgi:hypothetical protein